MSLPPDGLVAALADRYVIQRELGAGGMATVYLARDIKHDREVALKVLRPDLAAVLGAERFLNEIKITARLEHPHILTLIDSGVADGALYYVVPVVRGESLRERLKKEGQLPIEDALRIASQVASALDYAHRQGVIHRDIKPENILLQEGEAMLSDFGIALALKEAGGQRLTEAGLSLGTPQYMSPEQATGDRELDARSDVYSLASVLYEMLAGDPPHMGSTMQAVVAKLVTSQPTKLRALRDTVPVGVEEAVTKALAKAPADRYTSAGSFAVALAAGAAGKRPVGRRVLAQRIAAGALGLAVAAGLGIWLARSGRLGGTRRGVLLRDQLQLTTTGLAEAIAISADGKQIATSMRSCASQDCPRRIDVADADGSGPHHLLDASGFVGLEWSPDRRHLLVKGPVAGRDGVYLVSALGGEPRLVNAEGDAAFWAGGDSLLLTGPFGQHDSVVWIRVAGLDGFVRDSIRVAAAADFAFAHAVPGTSWMLVEMIRLQGPGGIRVIDRHGRQLDARQGQFQPGGFRAATNEVWWPDGAAPRLLRCALDPRSGRFSEIVDTVFSRPLGSFDVTADGATLVLNENHLEHEVYALDFREFLRGEFPPNKLLKPRSTAVEEIVISPDGGRVLFGPGQLGNFQITAPRLFTIPFTGGTEVPIATRGTVKGFGWADSLTIYLIEREAGKTRFVLADVRTGVRRDELTMDDSFPLFRTPGGKDFAPLPGGGWAWVAPDAQSIRVQRRGEKAPTVIQKPVWYYGMEGVSSAPDGRVAFGGDHLAGDSTMLSVVPASGGTPVPWFGARGTLNGSIQWLEDGSIFYQTSETQSDRTFTRARGPGRSEKLGRFEAPDGHIWFLSVSSNLKRVVLMRGYTRGDFWRWHVIER